MNLRTQPEYSERLASFFASLGRSAAVADAGRVQVEFPPGVEAEHELDIYLRVWAVIHPDAEVTIDH